MSKTRPSTGVQNRLQDSRTVVLAGYLYADVVNEAWQRRLRGFLDDLQASGEPGSVEPWLTEIPSGDEESPLTLGDVFRLAASDLEVCGETLLAHGETLIRRRTEHRRARHERKQRAKKVYCELSDTRKFFIGLFGHRQGCDHLNLEGSTPRDPNALLRWAQIATKVLADPEKALACRYAEGGRLETAQMAQRLEVRSRALDEAIKQAIDAEQAEVAALAAQRVVIKQFDLLHKRTAHLFEAALDYFGLPSLAVTVRPGVKRRGRPRKQLFVDAYPDLVRRVLGKDYRQQGSSEAPGKRDALPTVALIAETATGEAATPQSVDQTTKGDPRKIEPGSRKQKETRGKVETASNKRPGDDRKIETASIKRPGGDRKIETASIKRPDGDRKIETAPRKQSTGDRKIETAPRKQSTGDPKIETPQCEPTEGEVSRLDGAITSKRHETRPRIVHGLDPRLVRRKPWRGQRSGPSGARRRLKQVASAWWERTVGSHVRVLLR